MEYTNKVGLGNSPIPSRHQAPAVNPRSPIIRVATKSFPPKSESADKILGQKRFRKGPPHEFLPQLHYSCKKGRDEKITELLGKICIADLNAVDLQGRNALTHAYWRAFRCQDLMPLTALLSKKDLETWVLNDGIKKDKVELAFKCYHDLSKNNSDLLIKIMALPGFPINSHNGKYSFFEFVCREMNKTAKGPQILEQILKTHSFSYDKHPLIQAIEYKSNSAVEVVLKISKVGVDLLESWFPLHAAAWQNSWQIMKLLIAKGFNINLQNEVGDTPAMTAMRKGCNATVKHMLLQDNFDPSIENYAGEDLLGLLINSLIANPTLSQTTQDILISLLNSEKVSVRTITKAGDIFERLDVFNEWDAKNWIDNVLLKLSPKGLEKIALPAISMSDDEWKTAYLTSHQTLVATLLHPDYHQLLLGHLNDVFSVSISEVLGDDNYQKDEWESSATLHHKWLGYALWLKCPLELAFAEWLVKIGCQKDTIVKLLQALPTKEHEAATAQLGDCIEAILQNADNEQDSLSTLVSQKELLHIGEAFLERSYSNELAILQKKLSTYNNKLRAACSDEDSEIDTSSLLQKLVPKEERARFDEWLINRLGINSPRGLAIFYDVGLTDEVDFKKAGINVPNFKEIPKEQKRQVQEETLELIKEYIHRF